jgi:hypothetical protein
MGKNGGKRISAPFSGIISSFSSFYGLLALNVSPRNVVS